MRKSEVAIQVMKEKDEGKTPASIQEDSDSSESGDEIDEDNEDDVCCIPKKSIRADLIRVVKCIIWDEIIPQHQYAIEALDHTLCDLRDNDQPFGGVIVLMGGDSQQTLLVIPKGSRKQVVDATVTQSHSA